MGRESVLSPSQRGADLPKEKSPALVPNWSALMQIRTPYPHSLAQIRMEPLWLVGEDANEGIAAQPLLDRKSLNPFGQLFIFGALV